MAQRYNQPLRALLAGVLLFTPALLAAQTPKPADTEPWTIVPMAQASLVLARDGSLIGEIGKEIRTSVSIRSLPRYLPQAFVAVEDHRFYQHDGVDVVGIAGALKDNIFGERRGASTITQQLAKNLYLSPSRSIFRKLKEAVAAVRLELALSKDRIMELYLENAELGAGVWGIETASRAYFGVAVSALSANQAAELAATLPQPRTSNPMFRPARMLARRDLILARYYGGKTPVPPALEDSIPEIAPIEPPILPPILDTVVVDTLVVPDTTRDHPDSGGPVDSVRLVFAGPRLVYKP